MIKNDMFPELREEADASFSLWQGGADEWSERMNYISRQAAYAQGTLLEAGLYGAKIDEMAIMVRDEHQEYHLLEQAVREGGWEMFNAANDSVDTYPLLSHYEVHYTFLRHPHLDYRLEVMRLTAGVAPLHDTLLARATEAEFARPILVHASFKTETLNEFGTAETALKEHSLMLAQGCRSTYGAFAYFVPTMDSEPGSDVGKLEVYLKPRVNLRDAS